MEPIISPWFFYAISVIPSVATALYITLGIGITCLFVALLVSFVDLHDGYCPSDWAAPLQKTSIKYLLIFIPLLLLSLLIPPKEAMIQMAVASQATPDNIESIIGIGTALKGEVKSDVLDVINTIKE
jgi:hypothetical protein